LAIEEFLAAADDPRLGWVVVAIVLKLTLIRGLTVADTAGQLECSDQTLTRSMRMFRESPGLGVSATGIQPGAGSSNGDKPAAVQA
jgi:hypothetical protein